LAREQGLLEEIGGGLHSARAVLGKPNCVSNRSVALRAAH
jgi:hypothetical protein